MFLFFISVFICDHLCVYLFVFVYYCPLCDQRLRAGRMIPVDLAPSSQKEYPKFKKKGKNIKT